MNNYKFIKKRHPRRPAYHSAEYRQMLINEAITTAYKTDTDPADLLDAINVSTNPIL